MRIYIDLFIVFFKLGLFSFGGGYAVLSLLQHEAIDIYKWLDVSEFTEIVALSQITPGPISINAATYIGYKVSGNSLGALVSTVSVILPSTIIIMSIVFFLRKFNKSTTVKRTLLILKPTVIGLILSAGLNLLIPENFIDWKSYVIFLIALFFGFMIKTSALTTIAMCGVIGVIFNYIF